MKRTLRRQFAIFYTMPSLPPVLITIPFILALGSAFDPGTLAGRGTFWPCWERPWGCSFSSIWYIS